MSHSNSSQDFEQAAPQFILLNHCSFNYGKSCKSVSNQTTDHHTTNAFQCYQDVFTEECCASCLPDVISAFYPRSAEDHRDVFCKILRQGFVFRLVSSGLHLQHSVCQLSVSLWDHNTDCNWDREICNSFKVWAIFWLPGSIRHSWQYLMMMMMTTNFIQNRRWNLKLSRPREWGA